MRFRSLGFLLLAALLAFLPGCTAESGEKPLPPPSADPASMFGVDQTINMGSIDAYLGRDDVVYRDVRMLFDPADYAKIGGEADLTHTIEDFKIVPFPYIATLQPLPVDNAYGGSALYTVVWNDDGSVASATPNYEESALFLNDLFPRDKAIFLMCGGAGYAGMMKTLLLYLGWNADKLYNVGANWTYAGKRGVELVVYPEDAAGDLIHATWRADYAYLDFALLHPLEGNAE